MPLDERTPAQDYRDIIHTLAFPLRQPGIAGNLFSAPVAAMCFTAVWRSEAI